MSIPPNVKLRLANCQLTLLPATLSNLTNLKALFLENNQLEDIQEIQYLPQLEEISCPPPAGGTPEIIWKKEAKESTSHCI